MTSVVSRLFKLIELILFLTALGVSAYDAWTFSTLRSLSEIGKALSVAGFAQVKSDVSAFIPSRLVDQAIAWPAFVIPLVLAVALELIRRLLCLATGHHASGEKKWRFKR